MLPVPCRAISRSRQGPGGFVRLRRAPGLRADRRRREPRRRDRPSAAAGRGGSGRGRGSRRCAPARGAGRRLRPARVCARARAGIRPGLRPPPRRGCAPARAPRDRAGRSSHAPAAPDRAQLPPALPRTIASSVPRSRPLNPSTPQTRELTIRSDLFLGGLYDKLRMTDTRNGLHPTHSATNAEWVGHPKSHP